MKGKFLLVSGLGLILVSVAIGAARIRQSTAPRQLQTESREIAQTEITVTFVHGQFRLPLRQSETSMRPTGSKMLKWR